MQIVLVDITQQT